MYSNDLVVCIKSDGKVLREQKDLVLLPFGTEYSIYLKNLRNEKVLITKINIDGQDILNGNQLIINGKDSLELERFLGDDLTKGNKLKFIQKTEKISDFRGDRPEDGLITVEFQFEKKIINTDVIINNNWIYKQPVYYTYPSITWTGISEPIKKYDVICSNDSMCTTQNLQTNNIMRTCSLDNFSVSSVQEFNDVGITTKGSISEQRFTYGNIRELESNKYTITLQLKGKNNDVDVVKVITTSEKIQCEVCGTKNNSKNNYCAECGTYLK